MIMAKRITCMVVILMMISHTALADLCAATANNLSGNPIPGLTEGSTTPGATGNCADPARRNPTSTSVPIALAAGALSVSSLVLSTMLIAPVAAIAVIPAAAIVGGAAIYAGASKAVSSQSRTDTPSEK